MVDTSKREASLSSSSVILPPPLSEVDITFFIPFTLASIDSSLLVTSASITRDELPGILNEIVSPGKTRDGASLTGNNGTKAKPINAKQTKVTISVNEDKVRELLIDTYLH